MRSCDEHKCMRWAKHVWRIMGKGASHSKVSRLEENDKPIRRRNPADRGIVHKVKVQTTVSREASSKGIQTTQHSISCLKASPVFRLTQGMAALNVVGRCP